MNGHAHTHRHTHTHIHTHKTARQTGGGGLGGEVGRHTHTQRRTGMHKDAQHAHTQRRARTHNDVCRTHIHKDVQECKTITWSSFFCRSAAGAKECSFICARACALSPPTAFPASPAALSSTQCGVGVRTSRAMSCLLPCTAAWRVCACCVGVYCAWCIECGVVCRLRERYVKCKVCHVSGVRYVIFQVSHLLDMCEVSSIMSCVNCEVLGMSCVNE